MTESFLGVDWKALGVIITILFAWTGLLVKIIAWLLKRNLSAYDVQLKKLEESIDKEAEKRRKADEACAAKYEKLDQDFRHHLADLPKQYVQREDWLRTWTAVDAKMDSIWQSIRELIKDKKT